MDVADLFLQTKSRMRCHHFEPDESPAMASTCVQDDLKAAEGLANCCPEGGEARLALHFEAFC